MEWDVLSLPLLAAIVNPERSVQGRVVERLRQDLITEVETFARNRAGLCGAAAHRRRRSAATPWAR
jgi:hypothetical protein